MTYDSNEKLLWLKASFLVLFIGLTACAPRHSPLQSDAELVRASTTNLEASHLRSIPYLASIRTEHQELSFVASDHSPASYPLIKEAFQKFEPQLVIIEGYDSGSQVSPSPLLKKARRCRIEKPQHFCTEADLAVLWSAKNGLEFMSGEPTHLEVKETILAKGFTEEDILGFYLLRQIPQLKRQGKVSQNNFESVAADQLRRYRKTLNASVKFNFSDFQQWYKWKSTDHKPLLNISEADVGPESGPQATYFQKIAYHISSFRDLTLLKRIESSLNHKSKVLVVYGASHVLTLQPALEDMLDEKLVATQDEMPRKKNDQEPIQPMSPPFVK